MPCGGDATSWMLLMQLQSCSCINSIRPSNKRRIGTKEAQHTLDGATALGRTLSPAKNDLFAATTLLAASSKF